MSCAVLAGILCAAGTPGGLKVKAIAAFGSSSVAVAADGTVWEWGGSSSSVPPRVTFELSGMTSPVPVRVSGLSSITAVGRHVALKDDGTVWAWQAGSAAQVSGLSGVTAVAGNGPGLALKGDGTVWSWGEDTCVPAPVNGLSNVTAIAANGWYLAVKFDGTVWQWFPQGCTAGPASQVSGLTGVVAVAAGANFGLHLGLAVRGDGTVWEWRAGDPRSPNQSPPKQVSGLNDVMSVSTSGIHCLALKRDGTVWGWGENLYGQLGNGTTSGLYESSPPVQVSGLSGVTVIAAGDYHSLALQNDGILWVWGGDFVGQLGIGAVPRRSYPSQVRGLDGAVTAYAGSRGLVLKGDGTVWEWGTLHGNPLGAADAGSTGPFQVRGLTDVQAINAGWALKRDGTVWSIPPDPSGPPPVQIPGLDQVVAVSEWGALDRIWVRRDGTVWDGDWGGLYPVIQVLGLKNVVSVAGYSLSRLALQDDGTVWQWDWENAQAVEAQRVDGLSGVVAIAANDMATALRGDGTVWAWLGPAMPDQRAGVNDVTAIALGKGYSMAQKRDGTVWTWGLNDSGQLGDGTTTSRTAPAQVAGLREVKAITAGDGYALAVKRDGTVWAWGDNRQGQSGEECSFFRTTPTPVVPPGAPDLAMAVRHDGDFMAGDEGIYNLTITNVGLTATAGMITVTDTLPPSVTWIAAIGSDWGCSAADQVVTCRSAVRIEPGASSSIGLVVEVGSAAWPGVTNLAVVSNESDRNTSNNAAGDPTVVLAGAATKE